MIWFASVVLVLGALMAIEVFTGNARIATLSRLPGLEGRAPPTISIVVAARDEARGIEAAVRSMLTQRYPEYQLVVVDDRSTDGTGAILDRMAAADPRLEVVHVTDLPAGWLGKNHALQMGAGRAAGEWLLFTDADIHLDPETLSRAIRYCQDHQLDHLAASPGLILPGLLLQGFGVHFLYSFLAFAKPWRARDPKSWFFVGVGAFNLVRRSAYQAVGGHGKLRLRPDDDLKLGKVLKRAGFRQDAVNGTEMITVAWYHSLGEMIRGFEKNMFSGVEYNALVSIAGGSVQLAMGVLPVLLLPFASGTARLLLAAHLGVAIAVYAVLARLMRVTPAVALIHPVVILLFVYILWRTMVVNLWHGGIRWRGTFYSLRELKGNRV